MLFFHTYSPVIRKETPTIIDIAANFHPMRPVSMEAGAVAIIPIGIMNVKSIFPTPLNISTG